MSNFPNFRPPGVSQPRLTRLSREGAAPGAAGSEVSRQPSELEPCGWESYFDRQQDVQLPQRQATVRVYTAGGSGPVLLGLHGGGYSALTWALVAAQLKDRCRVVGVDMRGHGETVSADDLDLSAETLTADLVATWQALFGEERPPVVLLGHSMGGAVAVRAAASLGIANLCGLVVVDVVEGSALASLPHMRTILASRPPSFRSPSEAVRWALGTGMCRNAQAACVSIPSMLRQVSGKEAQRGTPQPPPAPALDNIAEEEGVEEGKEVGPPSADGGTCANTASGAAAVPPPGVCVGRWVWRTPLHLSQPHWTGWYSGLSQLFLQVPVPKMLILAGTDRLDRTLTIGQMQGKFQLVLLPQAGHAVHEDEAERTAEAVGQLLKRFRIGEPLLVVPRAAGVARVLPLVAGPGT